jgi:hypothetical protein
MRRSIVGLALVLVLLLAAMGAKSWLVQAPPLRSTTPAGKFAAVQAKARLAAILGDQRPHPADTPAGDAVRDRLLTSLRSMGIAPIVRDQFACNELYKARGASCARVRNVLARLGPPTGKAVLLNAHYDSTPVGPGAGDDGIGIATLLEVGRILRDAPLKRPVILLFNEGEELGLIGARAFLADPLSGNIDSLINLEARGVRGPVNMFETSRPNAAAVATYSAAVDRPVANSLSTDVYRLMPNYTDVNSFSERGWLTLNLAPIGNETRYHSPGDDIAALDLATLQHMGDQTLALTRALASETVNAPGGNRIFMDVAGRSLVSLPVTLGIVLLAVMTLAFALLVRRRGGALRGLAVTVGTLAGSALLAWLAETLVGALRPGAFWRAEPVWTHLATGASTIFVAILLLSTVARRNDVRQLRPIFWFFCLALGALIGIAAPGGIIFFLFPPMLALAGIVAARWWRPAEAAGSAAAIGLLYLTWGAMLGLLEELLNSGPMWLFAPLATLLIVPVLIEAQPLIRTAGARASAAIAGLLLVAGWAAAGAAPAYSADRQQRFTVQHVTNASSGAAWWSVVNDGATLPQGYRSAGRWRRGKLPFSERSRWLASAPSERRQPPPLLRVLSVAKAGSDRTVQLRLAANGWNDVVLLAPQSAKIRSAGVGAFVRPIDQSAEGKYAISCSGRSCDGATLQLTIGQPKPIELLVVGSGRPLPAAAGSLIAAKPRFARPQYAADGSVIFARARI